jgi:hypothetical protein
MKLITTLLLCSGLLLTLTQGEEAQEIDCNDVAVFQAVDFSLKQFNPGVKSGNQYMLHRVIEGTKTVSNSFPVKPLVIGALRHRGRGWRWPVLSLPGRS